MPAQLPQQPLLHLRCKPSPFFMDPIYRYSHAPPSRALPGNTSPCSPKLCPPVFAASGGALALGREGSVLLEVQARLGPAS